MKFKGLTGALTRRLTIRQMLLVLGFTGVMAIVSQTGVGLWLEFQMNKNQDRLINILPLESAGRGISIVLVDMMARQGTVLSVQTAGDLDQLTARQQLEARYKEQKAIIEQAGKGLTGMDDTLVNLEDAYAMFIDTDDQLFTKTKKKLALADKTRKLQKTVDATLDIILTEAETISAKASLAASREREKIKTALKNAGENAEDNTENNRQLRSALSKFINRTKGDIQRHSGEIMKDASLLAAVSAGILEAENMEVLMAQGETQVQQLAGSLATSISKLQAGLNKSDKLHAMAGKLDASLISLYPLLIEGEQSFVGLRKQVLALNEELVELMHTVNTSSVLIAFSLDELSEFTTAETTLVSDESLLIAKKRKWIVSVVAGVALIMVLSLMLTVIRVITQPLQEAVAVSDRLAEGDLTVEIHAEETVNETGKLLSSMSNMVTSLRELVRKVVEASNDVNTSASEISVAVEQEMAISTEQSTSVTEITSTMEELSTSSSQIAEAANSVLKVSTNTLQSTEEGAESVESLTVKMAEINTDNQTSIKEIVDLGKKSQEITKVMEIINGIADQTKLIAFNAAIEAAAAGEAGKRFSVVAAEIRRLADSVMESTGEIKGKINEIQTAVNRLVISSEKGSKGVQEGIKLANDTVGLLSEIVSGSRATNDAAKQITLSTQQQKTASDQVVLSLKEITEGSRQISVSITQTSSSTKNMIELSEGLKALVEKFKLHKAAEPVRDKSTAPVPVEAESADGNGGAKKVARH